MDGFSWRKRRILVVDDDAPVRDLLVRVLKDAGHLVVGADSGQEALKLAEQQAQLDLLVTDLVMRGMNGIELVQKIREQRPDLPVLITSSYTPEQLGHGGTALERVEFLEKPFAPAEIVERVASLLSS